MEVIMRRSSIDVAVSMAMFNCPMVSSTILGDILGIDGMYMGCINHIKSESLWDMIGNTPTLGFGMG